MISAHALEGLYDYGEVSRSVLIAIAASYVALDLAGRVTAARGHVRLAWLSGSATVMGIGIWAMHVKGMLAFRLPLAIEYDWPTLLASLLVAIFASAVTLYMASQPEMGWGRALTGSVFMGGGIVGLHYIAMAAMRSSAIIRYSPVLVALSCLLAILFSLIALLLAFDLREETRWSVPRRLGSSIVMGGAVSAMHYTGMAAATFFPGPPPDLTHSVNISPVSNNAIVIVTLIVFVAATVTSSVDKRTSEARLRLVIDTLPALVWSKLPDGSTNFLNRRFLDYTGLSLEEGLGWGWMNAFHPEDRADDEWRAAFAGGQAFERQARLRGADGKYREFEFRAVPLRDGQGKLVEWYGTSTDIENRRRAEDALLEAQDKLAHVTRTQAMGELVAAIAHEVNQPLSAITTNADFSLRELRRSTPNLDELSLAITEIEKDTTRASAVISRIRGLLVKGTRHRAKLDINEIIQKGITLLRSELKRNRVNVRTELAANLPSVQGDAVTLQQVLINLILNSLDAMRISAERPRELFIRSAMEADNIVVQVQDSGPGIGSELAGHIFEPFFTTKTEGIGMGLSISRSIIESHGGRLRTVPSSNGALFEFTIPTDEP